MAERARRVNRQIDDATETSPDVSDAESGDFDPRQADAVRRAGRQQVPVNPASRAKRTAASVSISPSDGDNKQSIKLTMKVAPSKLREVMRVNELDSLKDTLGGGTVLDAPRSSRRAAQMPVSSRASGRSRYVEQRESDLEDEDEDDEDDAEAELEEDLNMNDYDEIGAEAEGGTDDEDMDMDDSPAPQSFLKRNEPLPKANKITIKTPSKNDPKQSSRPTVVVTPADVRPLMSVEDEEMEDDPDDDDLDDSEMPDETNLDGDEEDAEGEDEEIEATMLNDEDAEGEDEELEGEDDDDDDDELDDSDDEPGSGTATPDISKLTARQRGRAIEPLMSLDMAPQQRKFFTDAEKAMKKDEHARKRKELTKRKTQEEKNAALNRLLKPQVSKTRGAAPKAETLAAQLQAAAEEEEVQIKADPMFTRWVSTKDGVKLGVPEEWLGKRIGQVFGPPKIPSNGALVQEL